MSLLKVNNLGKAFTTYASEWQRFARWFGLPISPLEEKWILKNISFEIHPGEAIGIIGQNGAGKSTLLKIITGTLKPTTGTFILKGRISAILELGMGFNPELTGRQNVIHTAGLLGLSYEDISQALPEIEAFAEIGEYFDQPMRKYSSGMHVRVAFAVATAYRPEILIVDEALSVGDSYFQHKSFDRIREFQKSGTTLLIVSHDRNAIQTLCNRAILLEKGVILKDGDPEPVFDFYNALIADKENQNIQTKQLADGKTQTISGTGEAKIIEIGLYNHEGELTEFVNVGELLELKIKVKIYKNVESLVLGFLIKDRLGQPIYGTNTWHTEQTILQPKAEETYYFTVKFIANFGVGSYSITAAVHDSDTHLTANYEWQDLAYVFNVINNNKKQFVGCNWLQPEIKVEILAA